MRVAASLDEENELKLKENFSRLQKENTELREILNIANNRGSLSLGPAHSNKTVQTEPE